jgi:hypothetical protein
MEMVIDDGADTRFDSFDGTRIRCFLAHQTVVETEQTPRMRLWISSFGLGGSVLDGVRLCIRPDGFNLGGIKHGHER